MSRAFLALVLLLATGARADEVRVFAAASLTDALTEIGARYEAATGDRVVFNFAASSTLARQIAEGAPADIFISADEPKVDWLTERNLIADRVALLSNRLVVVIGTDSTINITSARDLTRVDRLALAEPSSVPAGLYAREWLTKHGVWAEIAPRVVPMENVRAAMHAVEAGNAAAAIVYVTDARVSKRVRVAYEVPDGPRIIYPAAIVSTARNAAGARRFFATLQSEDAQSIFLRHGFASALGPRPSALGASGAFSDPWAEGRGPRADVLLFTIRTAALAALLILPPGLLVAWLLARYRWPGKSIIETIVALPLVMPPVATGLLLLRAFGRNGPFGALDVVFTWRAVVLAMMVMSFPLLVRAARVAFEEVNPRLEGVARTLGASNTRVFATITLPLAARGIIAGLLLAFARALGEFGATILVAGNIPGQTTTLSLAIYNSVQLGQDDVAFRLLLFSVIVAFAAVWLAEVSLRRTGAKP